MIPPEITTKKANTVTTITPEPTTTSTTTSIKTSTITTTTGKETNEVDVQPAIENQHRIGCKQGEFLPSTYCNKVS